MYRLNPTTLPAIAASIFALILNTLDKPHLWVYDCPARDNRGGEVNPSSPNATAWNLNSHFKQAIDRFCNPEEHTAKTRYLLQATLQGLFHTVTKDDVEDWTDDPDVTPDILYEALSEAITQACAMANRKPAAHREAYDILNTAASFLANHRSHYLGDLEKSPAYSLNATLEDAIIAYDVRNYRPMHHLAQAETQARWQLAQAANESPHRIYLPGSLETRADTAQAAERLLNEAAAMLQERNQPPSANAWLS